jgi:hypothetical protein
MYISAFNFLEFASHLSKLPLVHNSKFRIFFLYMTFLTSFRLPAVLLNFPRLMRVSYFSAQELSFVTSHRNVVLHTIVANLLSRGL